MVDGLALVRIDVKSWTCKVTVVGTLKKIESVLAFTAVKSSVDVDKISFNTFMEAYKYQLQRDAATRTERKRPDERNQTQPKKYTTC